MVKEKTGKRRSWRALDTAFRSWGCFFKTGPYQTCSMRTNFPLSISEGTPCLLIAPLLVSSSGGWG